MRLNSNELYKAVRLALTVGAASTAVAAPMAFAQDDAEQLETITVVGSRIKRTDIETSQPVFVLEREDLQKTGLTSVGDILQDLTTNGATLNTTFNNGGNGETRVNLRNLGSNRTLVLVNGRRWVTGLSSAVDLNTIPVSVIERVEVLKDGASAIYGSDAIAGVINITLRDTYDGAEASAYLGENEEGDGRTEFYDFTIGSTTDRANVVINASYAKQEPIFAGDREISNVPLFGFGGNNVNVGASSSSPFGRFAVPGIPGSVTLIPGEDGAQASDFRPFVLATDGFNFAPDNYLLTPQERTAFFAQGRYNITDTISFNTTLLYNERRSAQQLASVPITGGAVFGTGLNISATNFYNPFDLNITGRVQYRPLNTFARLFTQDVDTFYFGGGFDGSFDLFDRSFSWDVNYTYTDNEARDITFGQFDLNRIQAGLGPSFVDATGVPRCGTGPDTIIDGCVPINFFGGPLGFTQEMADYAGVVLKDETYKKLYNYTANITGDLFELPAGPLGFAAGYEYRREFGYFLPDAITSSGATTGNAAQPTRGGFSLDEFYVEFNIPILKDLAFAEIFEISIADRWSDYSNFGDTNNPKFGFRWKPFADLLVRGNYSDGFRAPSVNELFLGNADNFPEVQDPCGGLADGDNSPLAQRCRSGFGGVSGVPLGYDQSNTQIRTTVGGNPNLTPEEARTKTLGLVYSPSWLEGLDVYLDWYNIEITNSIGTPTAQTLLDQCYGVAPYTPDPSACAFITRGETGDVINLFAGNRNFPGGLEVEGYDFTINYRFDTEWGKWNLNWDNAYVSYLGDVGQPEFGEILPDGTASIGNVVGRYFTFNPNWRLKSNISANWQYGDWGATLGARYFSALDENCSLPAFFGRPELCSNPEGSVQNPDGENSLDETWYFDLQATWDAPWNARITGGIRNLFDEDPPFAFDAFANTFDPQYEVPGRFWYVQYNQKF